MSTIYVRSEKEATETLSLIQTAIEGEVAKLSLALELAQKRLATFEQKYGLSSEQFMVQLAAEDLSGGDEEYVSWAGEYQLMQRLQNKLTQLQEIEYGDPGLLHPDKNDN